VDTPDSWMVPHAKELVKLLETCNHSVKFCGKHEDVTEGDIAVFLSCEKIVSKEIRKRNKYNIVVHASDLPAGKGWSPTTWQVLEGKNKIPITLFEAVERVDAGPVYFKDFFILEGHELMDDIRKKLAKKIIELVIKFIMIYPDVKAITQTGMESFYQKRTPKDSELDVNKSIKDQFNLLRVVDNERYPAFFYFKNKKYLIKIYQTEKD